MKKHYKKPEAEWMAFQIEDVLTTSAGGDGGGTIPGGPDSFDPGMGGGNGYYDEPGL